MSSLLLPFYPLSRETWSTIDHYSQEIRLEVDRLLNFTYYPVALASALIFLFIYQVVSPTISYALVPRYRSFSPMQRIDWDSRVISTLHALAVFVTCVHEIILNQELSNNRIWCEFCLVRFNCAVVVGYLVADLLIMVAHWSVIGEVFFVTHHCVTIYAYYYVMSYGVLPWFANFRLLAELSTPFVNIRWFLDALDLRQSKHYAINGVCLFVSFFFARIITMPIYYCTLYSVHEYPAFQALGMLRYVAVFVCLILDAINMFWFSKIFAGAYKLFFGAKTPLRVGATRGVSTSPKRKHVPCHDPNAVGGSGAGGSPSKSRQRVKVFG